MDRSPWLGHNGLHANHAAVLGIFFCWQDKNFWPRPKGPTGQKGKRPHWFHATEKCNFGAALLALWLILVFVPDGVPPPLDVIVAMVYIFFTPRAPFRSNEVWRGRPPVIEKRAWDFLGHFLGTMLPGLDLPVGFHGGERFSTLASLVVMRRFYWRTGLALTGVIDNAHT